MKSSFNRNMDLEFIHFKNEVKYFFKSKILLCSICFTIILMICGMNSINLSNSFMLWNIRRTSLTIALGSAKYGAMAGTAVFSIITVLTLSKDKRKRSEEIIDSALNYSSLTRVRIFTILFYEIVTILIGMTIIMLIQIFFYSIPISFSAYIYCFGMVMFPAILFSIVISVGLYMLTESIDITLLIIFVLTILSITSNNYLFAWIQTTIPIFSDFAGIEPVGKLIVYNRILWCFISLTILLIGLLARRRYELDSVKSFHVNIKENKIIPLLLCTTVIMGTLVYMKEPYNMKHSLFENAPVNANVKLREMHPEVIFNTEKNAMNAHVVYEFLNNGSNSIEFQTNEGLAIKDLKVNGNDCIYRKLKDSNKIKVPIPNEEKIKIDIFYSGTIKYDNGGIAGYIDKDSIYLLEASNWIFRPLTENDDIVDITGSYSAPKNLYMVTPGRQTEVLEKDGNKIWRFELKSHVSDIGAFAAEYKKSQLSFKDISIEFYYSPKHEKYIKSNNIEKYLVNMMEYYSNTFGEYHSKKYPLKIVETSIYKPGGHSSVNVISFGEYMVNRENAQSMGSRYEASLCHDIGIISHEMAHQWWGTGVNVKDEMPWSSEGLAEYSSYKYLLNEFGEASVSMQLSAWENAANNLKKSYYLKSEKNLEKINKKYRLRFEMEKKHTLAYYVMPLELLKGEDLLGEKVFMDNLSAIYQKYLHRDLNYNDFINDMKLSKEAISIE